MANTYETLLVTHKNHVATITMNRPERRNALNNAMMAELMRAMDEVEASRCAVMVLTGAGEAFCAGMDLEHLQALSSRTTDEHATDTAQIAALLRRLYEFPKPTIAAVNGAAVAGGMGMATVCDFTLSVPTAKFGYTEVRIGFVPAIVSAFLLAEIGEKQARDLLLTGRILKAQEALTLGLLTRIVEHGDLMEEAYRLAQKLLCNSPESLRQTKALLRNFAAERLNRELALALEANALSRQHDDFREGVAAFLEKRAPRWAERC